MLALDTAVRRYLQEVLGIATPDLKVWARVEELPYFLRDAFEFFELELARKSVVLAMERQDRKPSSRDLRTWFDKLEDMAGQPVVYVTGTMASYERRRLIELKIPFIVPGNQLYLPDLGLDLREHFRQPLRAAAATLSPSAQAMLITALLRQPWQLDWQPSAIAEALGYTPMTLSRAVKELIATGLATSHTVGRIRWLRTEQPPQQIWEQAEPLLRSPVRRTAWLAPDTRIAAAPRPLAGLSALARYTMLAEPSHSVFAVSAADWKTALHAGIEELPEPVSGASEWQLWSYGPALLPGATTVDPLSLALSLRDNPDERIQLALDELKGQRPW